MHCFESLKEIAKFFEKHYYEFIRFDDYSITYEGVTYFMELEVHSPVPMPVLKLGYYDEYGDVSILACVVDFGLLVNTNETEDDKPAIYEYIEIVKEELFNLNFNDVVRFNTILENCKRDMK